MIPGSQLWDPGSANVRKSAPHSHPEALPKYFNSQKSVQRSRSFDAFQESNYEVTDCTITCTALILRLSTQSVKWIQKSNESIVRANGSIDLEVLDWSRNIL